VTAMHLQIHLPGADPYPIGNELGDLSLGDAITEESAVIVDAVESADLLDEPTPEAREQLRDRVILDMTAQLVHPGDRYQSPDGILYTLAPADP
jgi:hypothetical protein